MTTDKPKPTVVDADKNDELLECAQCRLELHQPCDAWELESEPLEYYCTAECALEFLAQKQYHMQTTQSPKAGERTHEDIIAAIAAEAQEAWERSNSRNWHSLILTGDGEIYWSEQVDQHSVSEAVWSGKDCRIMRIQGQPWNGADEDAYEMVEATAPIAAYLDAKEDVYGDSGDFTVKDEVYRRGRKAYGYDPAKWYRAGDLLSFADANPDITDEDYMADAIAAAEEFLARHDGCTE